MRILVLGGDKRYIEIIKSLNDQGHQLDLVGYFSVALPVEVNKKEIEYINVGDYDVIFFPINGVRENFMISTIDQDKKVIVSDSLLLTSKDNVLIFTGIMTDNLNHILTKANRKAFVLMNDKQVQQENSIPTVEGIIGDLVYNTDHTINSSNIVVLGYGNIGRLLVEKLMQLGANVSVGVKEDEDYGCLSKQKIGVFYTNETDIMKGAISKCDVIVNTVPSLLLNKECLDSINSNLYILDVASHPHGVDFAYANEKKIKNKLLMGIPSSVAPKTAGLILTKKINSVLKEDNKC